MSERPGRSDVIRLRASRWPRVAHRRRLPWYVNVLLDIAVIGLLVVLFSAAPPSERPQLVGLFVVLFGLTTLSTMAQRPRGELTIDRGAGLVHLPPGREGGGILQRRAPQAIEVPLADVRVALDRRTSWLGDRTLDFLVERPRGWQWHRLSAGWWDLDRVREMLDVVPVVPVARSSGPGWQRIGGGRLRIGGTGYDLSSREQWGPAIMFGSIAFAGVLVTVGQSMRLVCRHG